MKRRFVRLAALACASVSIVSVAVPAANAETVDSKRARAARLAKQIEANGMRIAALGERYNGAQLAFRQAQSEIAAAESRLARTRARKNRIETLMRQRAASLYRSMGSSTPLSSLDSGSMRDHITRSRYTAAATQRDGQLVEQLRDARDQLRQDRRVAQQRLDDARRTRDAAQSAKSRIEAANVDEQRLLAQVKGEIATLVAQEQQRRDSAARAVAARVTQPASSSRGPARSPVDPGSIGGNFPQVPVSGRVAAVIAYARAQIGKPYVYATSGPDTFDCSGLTMMAWRQAGVSMAHYSGSQFNSFPHVSLEALQPGDLVFKGPGGSDHVALYVGGGMQIAATHTGSYVKLQPLGTPLSGAVRPG